MRNATSKSWSSKLNNFSPARLAALLQHHHALPVHQAMHELGRMRGQFMAGVARLDAALHGAAAHLAHAAGLGFCHGGPCMAPPGLQSPWRFHLGAMASTSQWRDASGQQWNSRLNQLTGQHTSATPWSAADSNGLYHRQVMDHRSGWHGFDVFNSITGQHKSSTPLSPPDQYGTQHRTTVVMNNGNVWHESMNHRTGEHFSVGNWSRPDSEGVAIRAMFDHVTQQLSYEHLPPFGQSARPQYTAHFSKTNPSHHGSRPHFYTESPSFSYQTHAGRPQFYTDHTKAQPSAPRPQFSHDFTQAQPSAPRPEYSTNFTQDSGHAHRPGSSGNFTEASASGPRPEFSHDYTQASASGARPEFSTNYTEDSGPSSMPDVDGDAGAVPPRQVSDAEFAAALSALGLPSGASASDAKKAYYKLSKQHHPDKGGKAEDFQTLNAHYECLKARFEQA